MAAGKIAGHSTSAIARAEGVSRDWAAKELGSSECRQILASLVNGTLERLAQLYNTTLDTIEAGMKADKVVVANGCKLNLGADHYARLTAAKRFMELLTAGRPVPRAPGDSAAPKTITLEELERLIEQNKTEQPL